MSTLPLYPPRAEARPELRRDTLLLERLLGEVLEEQGGRAFRDRVFWLRDSATAIRTGDDARAGELLAFLHAQPAAQLAPYVRACSMQLQLANVAEDLERLRRRRAHDSDARRPQRESLAAAAARAARLPRSDVAAAVRQLDLRLVMLFDAIPPLAAELAHRFPVPEPPAPPALRFGSWAGGDMDGNPAVGGASIARTLALHGATALRLLHARVDALARAFSQARAHVVASPALSASIARDEAELLDAGGAHRNPHEPFRRKLALVATRLERMRRGAPGGYADPGALAADLELVRASAGSARVADGAIARLLVQVRTFGFQLAALDVRQAAGPLQAAVAALLPGYAQEDEPGRQRRLLAALAEPPDLGAGAPPDDPEAARTLAAFAAVADGMRTHGPQALGSVVISMARQPSDVLCPLLLLRRAGIGRDDAPDGLPALPLVPLFETVEDLARAQETMEAL